MADELCVYGGCVGESINHPTSRYHMNTGNRFGGDPAIGSRVISASALPTRTWHPRRQGSRP